MQNGVSFCSLLALLFIGLKLANVINWSWWLVLLPLYFPVVVILFVLIFGFVVAAIGLM